MIGPQRRAGTAPDMPFKESPAIPAHAGIAGRNRRISGSGTIARFLVMRRFFLDAIA